MISRDIPVSRDVARPGPATLLPFRVFSLSGAGEIGTSPHWGRFFRRRGDF